MDIFAKLNDKQLLAVKNTEGFVRVIAGAGSGKTKLLVSRYAYLVKEYGIDSANILWTARDRVSRESKNFRPVFSMKLVKRTISELEKSVMSWNAKAGAISAVLISR